MPKPSEGRKLTTKQSAVLATLARRGPSTITDVAGSVGAHNPSDAERVLAALARRGLVELDGDPALVYADGVMYWLAGQAAPMKECVECGARRPHKVGASLCVGCRAALEVRAMQADQTKRRI